MSESPQSSPQNPQFSKLRAALWPIQSSELKKFLPMSMMMFFGLFNYTLLRNAKDALMVTAPLCGAEVIPFIKLWGVMPAAVVFFFIYTKLSNHLSQAQLFYTSLSPFLVFFVLFAFLIYPYKECLHPTLVSVSALREAFPHFKWFFSLYGNWSYALFYILAELWGSVVICLLFWQFANEVTRTREAKRFYSLFGFVGNSALILSGSFTEWLGTMSSHSADPWGECILYMMTSAVIAGVGMLLIYQWMNRYVLTDPVYYEKANRPPQRKDKKPSFKESLFHVFTSKYLGCILLLVVGYGLASNLVDVTWKSQLKEYLPRSNDYLAFMGRFSFWTGIATMGFIMLTKGIVRRFGWFPGALLTPLMFLITSTLFFAFIFLKGDSDMSALIFGMNTVYLAVMIGSAQNILSKGMKYSLFDPTKEMAYIPLDQDLKIKGKAAVDILGARLGKSGGSFIQFALLTITAGSQLTILPYLCGIILIAILLWMVAAKTLSKLYEAKVRERE